MQALSATGLLNLWEEGFRRTPVEQALLLLYAAFPERTREELAQLNIGQRDALLLRIREQTFRPNLVGLSACPNCGERLETTFTADEILESMPALVKENAPFILESGNFKLTFRLPTSLDVHEASNREGLLAACVLEALRDDTSIDVTELPEELIQALTNRMEQIDPLANLTLPFTCPACGTNWQSLFDITSFFWSEINAWAARILYEVHLLASAYGWSEKDILSMSALRRQHYLGMVSV
jgi:hypothetical protein